MTESDIVVFPSEVMNNSILTGVLAGVVSGKIISTGRVLKLPALRVTLELLKVTDIPGSSVR